MTTNGTPHPIPATPPVTPVDRPTFRRLVVDVYEVGADGKEWVLETVDVETTDLLAECQARGLLGTELPGHVTRIERPNITINGSVAPAEVAEALVDAINEVVGTTPSGEAVMVFGVGDVPLGTAKPAGVVISNGAPIPTHEEAVRMVGADRAEAGKMPSERIKEIANTGVALCAMAGVKTDDAAFAIQAIGAYLDERLGRGGT